MSCACETCEVKAKPASNTLLTVRFILSSLLFGVGLLLSFNYPEYLVPIRILYVASWAFAGYRVVLTALGNLVRGKIFDENFLMTVSTIGAFIIGEWSEGAAVMLFYNLGEIVQESAVARSRQSITRLMDVRAEFARFADSGELGKPDAVSVGSVLRVLPGEKIPLDGIVTDGESVLDTSRLTGESVPRSVSPGSEILAGSINLSGVLVFRTTTPLSQTAAARMLDLIENAQSRKAKAEKLITSFARVYTPIVTAFALLLALIPPLLLSFMQGMGVPPFADFSPWIYRALVFLVISCPCAFVISVPLGYFGGIGGAAKNGVLVKGAPYIDVLSKAKAVVFDKTGTLTRGVFTVSGVETAKGVAREDFLEYALAAEYRSNHPLAQAVAGYAKGAGISVDETYHGQGSEESGYGTVAVYRGHPVLAGSRTHLVKNGVILPPMANSDSTEIHLARDGAWMGRITLSDEPKQESAEAIRRLFKLGVERIAMLTGDTPAAARIVAEKTGIHEVHSGMLPHRKVEVFEEISASVKSQFPKGTVLFVGDGINDAPVLTRSDAGIAMGGMGSDAAIEAADVVLMTDNPLLVERAIRSARWTQRIVRENIALSFAVKIGFLLLGALGIATLWEAVFADVGVALLATLNSLRARNPKTAA